MNPKHNPRNSAERLALLKLLLAEEGSSASAARKIPRRKEAGPAPLSFSQERLWFLDQLDPGVTAHNLPMLVRLAGPLDRAALEQSLDEIVRRHEALRTIFKTIDGRPMQVITPSQPLPLPLTDLQDLPGAVQEAEVQRLGRQDLQRPFDLSQGPLIRARLIRTSQEEHFLLLVLHHIIFDGWSMGVFFRELGVLYEGYSAGRPGDNNGSPLPPLPVQYADFAVWHRERLQGELLEQQLGYWRRQLGGRLPVLELPADRPRPAVQTFQGAMHYFRLPQALNDALKALSQREDVTLFMTLLAAFDTLILRYTGQADILVGSPIANRNHAEIEELIGFFVNTLVLRADLSSNPTFRELLGRVREVALDAYAHQDLPFEKLVEALAPERDVSHTPLFQVMFILQNAPLETLALPTLTLSSLKIDGGTAQFDLMLILRDTGREINGLFQYNTDLFDTATIVRMNGHLQTLLEGIVADPGRRLANLPLLSAAERRQLLLTWNDTQTGDRRQETGDRSDTADAWCIQHLFETQAARTPDAIAVVFDGQTKDDGPPTDDRRPTTADLEQRTKNKEQTRKEQALSPQSPALSGGEGSVLSPQHMTYHELNRRANQLAHHLRALGAGPEVRVGLSMERSPEMLVGLLGVLKAGGAYVPLDPAYPTERLAFMLADAQVAVLLTQREIRDWRLEIDHAQQSPISNLQSPITIYLDADWERMAQASEQNPASDAMGENLAYVIYTSGSTGAPKGVLGCHRGAVNRFTWMWRTYPFEEGEVCCQKTALSFVDSVWELFGPLLQGVQTAIIPDETLKDPHQFVQALAAQRVTRIVLVPSLLRVLLETFPDLQDRLPRLKYWVTSGEALPADLSRSFIERMPRSTLLNLYGSSEVAADASWYDTRSKPSAQHVPIGRPIANTHVYVLDRYLQLAPIGVPGELYIGGDGLARGYLNRPDLTAERFVPNPFTENKEQRTKNKEQGTDDEAATQNSKLKTQNLRLYRTGDLARYLPDGNIIFLGRVDHQVKIRGYRIELGEVEAVLLRHPGVREAVVLAREDVPGGPLLVAYVVEGSGVRGQGSADLAQESLIPDPRSLIPALRDFLKQKLPDYMAPSAFIMLDALPLTPSGKVDRRALPAPDRARFEQESRFVAPRTPVEELLAEIWSQVLGVDSIGVHDNFFESGGHSLLATQVLSRVRDTFEVEMPLRSLFQAPTVAGQAEVLVKYEVVPGQVAAISRLLRQIDEMSADEVELLLGKHTQS